MTVELAVLIPTIVVVGLIIANLVRFCGQCAVFDRVALDAALAQGVAPSGDQTSTSACNEVREAIASALDGATCEVDVAAESGAPPGRSAGLSFPVSPLLTTYRCTLRYRPWPGSFQIAGVVMGTPAILSHERSIVVDRFRAGVVA
jgi:hypothetical protein